MAQPQIRKKCTVTSSVANTVVLTPTTNDKSPAVPMTTITITYSGGSTADFFSGSGRYNVIMQRL